MCKEARFSVAVDAGLIRYPPFRKRLQDECPGFACWLYEGKNTLFILGGVCYSAPFAARSYPNSIDNSITFAHPWPKFSA